MLQKSIFVLIIFCITSNSTVSAETYEELIRRTNDVMSGKAARRASMRRYEKVKLRQAEIARRKGDYKARAQVLNELASCGFCPDANHMLAEQYLRGQGVERNYKKAAQLCRKAVRGSGGAAQLLGLLYFWGAGVEQSNKLAYQYLKRANVNPLGNFVRGCMEEKGVGTEKNMIKAFQSYEKSSLAGSPAGKASLAEFYYLGKAPQKNPKLAKKIFQEAAAKGSVMAQFYLAEMYVAGIACDKDLNKASTYYSRAKTLMDKKLAKASTNKFNNPIQNEILKSVQQRVNQSIASGGKMLPDDIKVSAGNRVSAKTAYSVVSSNNPQTNTEANETDSQNRLKAKASDKKAKEPATIFKELETVITQYYPKAVVSKKDDSLHIEFKTRKVSSSKEKLIPKLGGIVCDITVKAGKYKGKEYLPVKTNETLYVSLLMAPYSASSDTHLLTTLLYPHNIDLQIIKKVQSTLNSFQ